GITPGPSIVQRRGHETRVLFRNIDIPNATSVHLHGNASAPQFDGWADDTTDRFCYKVYEYPNEQPARTLWYHDHGVHHTAHNAYNGLAGFYITHDANELGLGIPQGRYDVPLMIKDAMFASDGSLLFDDHSHSSLMGDVILVNGVPWPRMKVERRKYRFRILNAGISRSFELSLSTGEPFEVIATDGGLMPRPQRVTKMRVGMAERYEIVIDFAGYRPGQRVVLRNVHLKNNTPEPNTDKVMAFDIVDREANPHNNRVPARLTRHNEVMDLTEADVTRRQPRRMELVRQGGEWTINGRTWRDRECFADVQYDAVEVWELVNKSGGWFHPLHIHLIDFKILDRNRRPPHPYELGPKDVAYIGEGESVRVIARFNRQRGKYMVHCHNLVHEDHDMMTFFEVGRGGPDPMSVRDRPWPPRTNPLR
ncbi:MAG: multicopper oxidase family protein, partial [Actinomycetota bacterium]